MYNILKLNEISPVINDVFSNNYNVTDKVANPEGILLRSFVMHDYNLESNLLAVARAGAGVNNIPIEKCSEKGIVVFNTPGANANAVNELVICALLLASRKIVPAIQWSNSLADKGAEVPKLVEKGKSQFVGGELLGKKLGVIGLGAIGALVANSANSLGMEVLGYDPFLSVETALSLSRKVKKTNDINEIYKTCDYITMHVPLTNDTKAMINKNTIALMKDGVAIVNCSRGELVDNADIIEATKSGKVARFVTDFPNETMLNKENIIAIPHLGASTPEAEDNCAYMAGKQLVDFIENGNIKNSVNFPAASMPRSGEARIAILHKNVKSLITKMTGAISACNANIENMVNASKGDLSYTIIDVCTTPSKELIETLSKIDDVIRVRVIK